MREDLEGLTRAIQDEHAGEDPGHALEVRPLREAFTSYAREVVAAELPDALLNGVLLFEGIRTPRPL